MMVPGQINSLISTHFAGYAGVQESHIHGSDSEAAFALVYEAILGLSDENCSQVPPSDDWLDNGPEDGHPGKYNFTGLLSTINLGSSTGNLNLGYSRAQFSGSSMDRLLSRNRGSQVEPVQSLDAKLLAREAETRALQNGDSNQSAGQIGNVSPASNSAGVLNKSQLSEWMDAHALSRSSHHCAKYFRLGMEAAGVNTGDRPQSGDAGDYGPFLLRHGAEKVSPDSYVPQVGDVAVFDKTSQHPYGHIEMFDGRQWVSDFMQHSFSPYRDADSTPTFTIYRLA